MVVVGTMAVVVVGKMRTVVVVVLKGGNGKECSCLCW